MKSFRLLLASGLFLACFAPGASAMVAAGEETGQTAAAAAPADPTSPELKTIKYSPDGRMAMIPVDPDNIEAIKEIIQQFQFPAHQMTVALYTPVGLLPQILVSGDPPLVTQFVDTVKHMFLNTGEKHMVVIAARLSQLTSAEIRDLGINIFPDIDSYSAAYTQPVGGPATGQIDILVNSGTASNIIQMDENLSKGKILVASEVFTPNGVKTQISDVQHVPVFSTDSFGNVQTNYQDLETSVSVTPTVTRLDAREPAGSTVRLDIEVKVSIESGERRLKDVTAPEYTDKKFQTTRVFPADGRTYLVGTFVSDSDLESESRVPILGEIPLLKYLFTQKTTNKNRNYALLTLAVRVFPAGPSSDELRKPWFAKPGAPAEGDSGRGQDKNPHPDPEPLRWGGDMTFTMSSNNQTVNPAYSFIIHFVEQAPANALAGKGCWVSLQKPTPPAANKWYNSSGALLNGRWCTPIGDTKMHNIMTMASDKFIVSLYSPDNKAVVLVLQQNYSSIWGNDAKDWMGWELDWVDNGESSVPGQ